MSKSLDLFIETEKSAQEVIEIIAQEQRLKVSTHLETFGFSANESAIWAGKFDYRKGSVRLLNESKERWQKEYGFIPTVVVTFRYHANQDPTREFEGMKTIITKFLQLISGNMVFIDDTSEIVFEKINNNLILADTIERPVFSLNQLKEEFDLVGIKFRVKSIPYRDV